MVPVTPTWNSRRPMTAVNPSFPSKALARRAGALFVLGTIIGLLWLYGPHFADPEFALAKSYVELADDIAKTGDFARSFPNGRVEPETLREPLYPYALLVTKRLTGHYDGIVLFQRAALIGACLVWILAVWRWCGLGAAMLLTGLVLMNPVMAFYAAVLYPYAFNVLFVSAALMLTLQTVKRRQVRWPICAGLMFGLAVYERGSLALLPFFLVGCLFLVPALVPRRHLGILAAVYLICVLPWIFRNARYGVGGMNGMVGYALGYTYGGVVLAETEAHPALLADDPYGLKAGYLDNVRRETSDGGTIDFIRSEESKGLKLGEINKAIVYYVRRAALRNPARVWDIVRKNLWLFPARILVWRTQEADPWLYYRENVCLPENLSWMDLTVCGVGLLGLALMACNREPLVIVVIPTMFYLIAMNSVMIVDDPRYRNGVFDIFTYMAGIYSLRCCYFQLRFGNWRLAGLAKRPAPVSR